MEAEKEKEKGKEKEKANPRIGTEAQDSKPMETAENGVAQLASRLDSLEDP